jgi:UDP-N-acetylglucosamine--N-acetylmuramyl-(pentapeptide) pyrophosphoryl-undecaprenol N-acetylglucosamine transferase
MSRTIMIMAGGTGGHIYPGLAVADVLHAQGWKVIWLGVPGSMEADLVPKAGYEMAWVNFSGVRGKGLLRKLALPFNLLRAFGQCLSAMLRHRPDVVLGMGGYVTVPGGLMASLLLRPLVIHEQNSVAGMSNKLLAKFADRVLSGFPDVLPKAEWIGNPLRDSIAKLPYPGERYAARTSHHLNVLVMGGSLGAQVLNSCMPQALAMMPADARPHVIHQSGRQHFEATQTAYRETRVEADVRPFLDNMAECYSWADLVICRAGALTVSELAAAGVASVLVPYPFAVDDHQTANAAFLVEHGAAVLMPQDKMTPLAMSQLLAEMTRERVRDMAIAARGVAHPAAAERVAQVCKELAA